MVHLLAVLAIPLLRVPCAVLKGETLAMGGFPVLTTHVAHVFFRARGPQVLTLGNQIAETFAGLPLLDYPGVESALRHPFGHGSKAKSYPQ